MPTFLGPTAGMPGAVDYMLDDGTVVPIPAAYAPQALTYGGQTLPAMPQFAQAVQQPVGTGPHALPPGAIAQSRGVPADPRAAALAQVQAPEAPAPAPGGFAVPAGDPLSSAASADAWAQGLIHQAPTPEGTVAAPLTGPREGFPGVTGPQGVQPVYGRRPGAQAPAGPATSGAASGDLELARRAVAAALQPRAGGGPVTTQRTQVTETRPGPVDPELSAALGAANARERETLRQRFATQADSMTQMAGEETRTRQLLEQQAAEHQAREQDIQVQLQHRQNQLDEAIRSAANLEPSTARFWARPDTPSRIGAAIGVFLGGFGGGLLGRPNEALATIQQAIDRDIDIQQAQVVNAHRTVQERGSAYQTARQIYEDERAAASAARAMLIEAAQARIRARIASSQSAEIRANGEAIIAQLDAQKLAAIAAAQQAQVQWQRQTTQRPGGSGQPSRQDYFRGAQLLTGIAQEVRQGGGELGGPSLSPDRARAMEREDRRQTPPGTRQMSGYEGLWQSVTPENRFKIGQIIGGYQTIDQQLARLEQIRAEHGPEAFGALANEIDVIRRNLVVAYNRVRGGVLQQHDEANINALLGDAAAWSAPNWSARGAVLRREARRAANNELGAAGGLELEPTPDEVRARRAAGME